MNQFVREKRQERVEKPDFHVESPASHTTYYISNIQIDFFVDVASNLRTERIEGQSNAFILNRGFGIDRDYFTVFLKESPLTLWPSDSSSTDTAAYLHTQHRPSNQSTSLRSSFPKHQINSKLFLLPPSQDFSFH